ncbi:hypothetical protein [Methylophilus medardicus]|uniref:Uncharacterized protein n=1 Tax=Methylophilus medardicus TaxID=2588534 RepID=A0A5B8CTU5_9PROT|nr:hypothetical protein [Methylophilus medardicus]QDC44673.1 hypothetical protein FIU01_09110 [Methylophilus medardicus]QDC49680.1 hypothetical protein FIU00_09110 [Methylophilus medardicus]QDC53385.1 hypothetical protein FIT99_09110 [Methylophilus medardicus]
MTISNPSATIQLDVLNWRHSIHSPYTESKVSEPFKAPPRETWDVLARFQDPNAIELSNGQNATDLEISLWLIAAAKNADWVEKYKLKNTAGALIFHEDALNNFVGGTLVVDDEAFHSIIAAVTSAHLLSTLFLTIDGLQSAQSSNATYSWNIEKEKKLTVTHIEAKFHYGQA